MAYTEKTAYEIIEELVKAHGVGTKPVTAPLVVPLQVSSAIKKEGLTVGQMAMLYGEGPVLMKGGTPDLVIIDELDESNGTITFKPLTSKQLMDLNKAAVKQPPIIAIGKKGGKIIGYGPHHKPIYLDETKQAKQPQTAQELPPSIIAYLKSGGVMPADKSVIVEPHPTKGGVWSITFDKEWTWPEDKAAAFKAFGLADKHGIKTAKNWVDLKDGSTKFFIKEGGLPKSDPKVKTHEAEPTAPDVTNKQVATSTATEGKYKKTAAAKPTSEEVPVSAGAVSVQDVEKLLKEAPHKWQILHAGPEGTNKTKAMQLAKWTTTGKFAPKGVPKDILGWPQEWPPKVESGEMSVQVAADKKSFTIFAEGHSFTFMPAGVKKHWPASFAAMDSWMFHGPAKQSENNFETMPDAEQKPPLPEPKKVKEPKQETYSKLANLGGANGAVHLVTNHGKHIVWKPVDKLTGPAETGASSIANYLTGGLVPVAEKMAYKGKSGVFQPMITLGKNTTKSKGGFDPTKLNKTQAAQLFAHMISDWVVSNYDAHSGNFGLDEKGNVVGIDKGQAFKFFQSGGVKSAASGKLKEPKSFDEYFTQQWPPLNNDKVVYKPFVEALKSGKVDIDPHDPIIKAAIEKAEKMSLSMLEGQLKKYATTAFKSKAHAFMKEVQKRCQNVGSDVSKLWEKIGVDLEPASTGSDYEVIKNPAKLKTKVNPSKGYMGVVSGKKQMINDPRDGWLNGTVELGGKTWKIIGRKRSEKHQVYGDTSHSDQWLVRSGKTSKWVSTSDLKLSKVTAHKGNPLYGDVPDGALVVKADAKTKKMMKDILKADHKNGKTYQDVIDIYQSNGVATAVAGGLLRDVLQGKKGKDVDIVVNCSAHTSAKIALSDKGWIKGLGQSYAGGKKTGQKFAPVQSLLKVHDDGEGMDIASMRGFAYNSHNYKKHKKAAESFSFAEDSLSRDFSCNAIFYDTENDAIIDVSGRGIEDAKNKVLHPPTEDFQGWANNNGPRNFVRSFKFIARGYSMTPELLKFMKDSWSTYKNHPTYGNVKWDKQWENVTYAEGQKAAKLTPAQRKKQWNALNSWLNKNMADRPDIANYVKQQYHFLKY